MIRTALQDMVNPLINGQKKNQSDVIKVMDEIKAMRTLHENSMKAISETQSQLEQLPSVTERLREAEIAINQNQKAQKLMNESLVDRCERIVGRISEVSKEYSRLEGEMNSRDSRVKNNTEMILEFKDKISTELATFMRQMTRELDGFSIKTNKAA